jgi:hypothetical protein
MGKMIITPVIGMGNILNNKEMTTEVKMYNFIKNASDRLTFIAAS